MCMHFGEPVFFKRGWAEGRPMRVRILCGAYELSSPFIEGGCATDWVEDLAGAAGPLECPGCGRPCPEEIVGCAKEMLTTRVVFVFGCTHQAFTFSRRHREPYFCASEASGEV